MQPVIRPQCSLQLAHLRDIAASSIKNIMDLAVELETETANLPAELKPIWETLTEITMHTIIKSYAESLQLLTELEFQEICRAAIQPNHQTEPDLLERSMNDAI
jgi:hypothetical protein